MNKIITIGREFGSGGREFARRLAETLGYEYYDNEIIMEIAKNTALSEEYVRQVVECEPHKLYPITIGNSFSYVDNYAQQQIQSIYYAQSKILKELAEKSNCIMVGRCADYILREYNPYRIFIYASLDSKIKRCVARNNGSEKYSEKEIKKYIEKIDKQRAKYYEHYTDQKWGNKENYDLCINTTNLVIKDVVDVVAKMLK
ncbi:MAG: cytidylate kinase-like family protein [Bacilli bacterium]|nr:cytidylate kinase-like family protein [Bacilli bacterium]